MVDTLLVELKDEHSRQAPMTWGQLAQQAIFDFIGEESYRQNLLRSVDIPAGMPLERAAAAMRTLLTRYESLRTLFTEDHQQRVRGDVRLEVPVVTVESAADLARVRTDLGAHIFHHDTQPPVRFGVTVLHGQATLHVVTSHLAVDGFGADLLAEQARSVCAADPADVLAEKARRLCAADPAGPPPASVPVLDYQPADRAAFERSDAGLALSRRNIRRWTSAQEAGTLTTPRPTRQGLSPRFWSASLVSPTLRRSLPAACQRWDTSSAVVLLAALASGLAHMFDLRTIPIRIAYGNRAEARDNGVETLMQWGLTVLDATQPPDALIRTAFRETLRASAGARYHTYDLFEALTGTRTPPDQTFLPQFFMNYYESDDDRGPEPPTATPDTSTSVFTTEPSHERDSEGLLFMFAFPTREAITLYTIFDTGLLSPDDAERLTRGLEAWVVRTAGDEGA